MDSSIVKQLTKKQLINPPSFLPENVQYECLFGSISYGCQTDNSDIDVYGFCIPPKDCIFPHLRGEILGFGRQKKRFEQYQQHHVQDKETNREYDLTIYSITKYFQLCLENNPNMIDSLFVPQRCVVHCTRIGDMVRENRKMFLHKGAWFKFKGYSFAQINKIRTKKNPTGKRKEIVKQFSYDLKYATHCIRLLNEIEQIMMEGDLDLERNREQLKSIRRGDWSEQQIIDYFNEKERSLENLYTESKLPHSPDEERIKNLLLNCLEEHYGSLDKCIVVPDRAVAALREIQEVLDKHRNLL